MEQIQAHVAEYKKDIVKKLVDLIMEYPIIAIVNIHLLLRVALMFCNCGAGRFSMLTTAIIGYSIIKSTRFFTISFLYSAT